MFQSNDSRESEFKMNDDEVKEAIKICNTLIIDEEGEISLTELFKRDERIVVGLKNLINLAQLYLTTAGKMPEEKRKYKIIGIMNIGRIKATTSPANPAF